LWALWHTEEKGRLHCLLCTWMGKERSGKELS
jgi:hypothetical protein